MAVRVFAATACVLLLTAPKAGRAADKVVDRVLFPHDPKGVFRWSEGSTLNLDGKGRLLMLVTAFGHGGHDSSHAEILEFHSADGGLTWTPPEKARVFQKSIGKQNTMAPSLLRLDNGDLLCMVTVTNSITDAGPWLKRSTDGGKTWGEPVRLPYEGYGSLAPDALIQLRSGRVLAPCWVSTDRLASSYAYCFYSDDRGRSWKKTALIRTPPRSTGRPTNPAAEEPMVVELKDGRLMMVLRTYLKSIYKCYSGDGGATWSEPVSSGIPSPGSMATLRRLPNGHLLLIWNWARVADINGPFPRTFLTAAVSTDEGRSFRHVRHLDGAADYPGKITMANAAFAGDNVVLTYSSSPTKKNAYNWRVQVLPLAWFYEGDARQVYGESYLPTLREELRKLKPPAEP